MAKAWYTIHVHMVTYINHIVALHACHIGQSGYNDRTRVLTRICT